MRKLILISCSSHVKKSDHGKVPAYIKGNQFINNHV